MREVNILQLNSKRKIRTFISRTTLLLTLVGLFGVSGISGLNPFVPAPAEAVPPSAGINNKVNYQGRLLNAAGAVIADGNYNMQFKLYKNGDGLVAGNPNCTSLPDCQSTAGTLLWTEEWLNQASNGVTVKNGYFSVNLGTITTLVGVDLNQPVLWLSTNVAGTPNSTSVTCTPFSNCTGDGEMLPMRRIGSALYAVNAGSANTCTSCILQAPTSTAQNTITPTVNSVVGLTVNGTSGTAATAIAVNQTQAADGITLAVTNASGTQTNGILVNRNAAGGTTTNGLDIVNTLGTTTNGIQLTQAGGTFTTGINFTGTFGNLLVAPNFSVANSGLLTTASNVAVNGGTISSTTTLTLDATSTVIIPGADTLQTDDVTSTGALSLATAANGALNLSPNGTGDVVATLGNDSQFLVNATPTADTAQDSFKLTLNPTITGSTAALQGLVVSQSDNANTGVYDTLLKVENLKTPETTTNGIFIQQNAAAGTLTNGLQITNTAGNLTTGVNLTGTFTNYLQAPNFVLNNAGQITSGIWQGTAVGATFGGTGQTVYAVGDLLYASTTTALSKLADVATGQCLISGGIGVAPSWGSCASGFTNTA